ncbi:hypothetical protein D3C85_1592200 [compost metagenome]
MGSAGALDQGRHQLVAQLVDGLDLVLVDQAALGVAAVAGGDGLLLCGHAVLLLSG